VKTSSGDSRMYADVKSRKKTTIEFETLGGKRAKVCQIGGTRSFHDTYFQGPGTAATNFRS
jgi:hypothetical protein